MIRQEEVYKIGQLGKPHGIKGDINFNFADDIFDRTEECDYLVFLLDGIFVPFFIEEYRFKTDTVAIIKFEGIDSDVQARRFTGTEVFFPTRYAEESGEVSWNYFVGFSVEDRKAGIIGRITAVDDSTLNTLFILTSPCDAEFLIPAQESFITDINHQQRIIRMNLPEGLV